MQSINSNQEARQQAIKHHTEVVKLKGRQKWKKVFESQETKSGRESWENTMIINYQNLIIDILGKKR